MNIHVTTNHTGKMEGMTSISTCALTNEHCIARRNVNGCICARCYACTMEKRYTALTNALLRNSTALSTDYLQAEDIPTIDANYCRLEAFGDLINETHLLNYITIVNSNPHTMFALWTKNFAICSRVFAQIEKPTNLHVVASSPMLNTPINEPVWADATFTVWTSEEIAQAHGESINCGKRKCIECLACYKGTKTRVNELLK